MKLTVASIQPSLSRVKNSERAPLKVGLVQARWIPHPEEHKENIASGVRKASEAGAKIVFLQELTLSRYPADAKPAGSPDETAEDLETGETFKFASDLAAKYDVIVHASLFEKASLADSRGYNTAILVSPSGTLIGKTRKLHIPVTAGYYEDKYFTAGPAAPDPYPVYPVTFPDTQISIGLPTCWDEWFPEVARAYSLGGAELLAYPTAIGSEPDHPNFDTQPLWQAVITGNAIANGTFMVVPNRWGNEGSINFYGGSFICDPFGRILVKAASDADEVLVAELDLDQRRDWLDLFPFLATRRPDTYGGLVKPVQNPRQDNGDGIDGGIAGIAQ
jgi:N-carbamoylputrescine amidase